MAYSHFDKVAFENGFGVGVKGSETEILDSNGIKTFEKKTVTAKAADYTVTAAETGRVFTTTGATGAVNFTLPAKATGLVYTFLNTVDQNMTITSDAVDTIVTFNDVAADSVAFSTVGEKIGAAAMAICDGTKWIVVNLGTHTATVAT